MKRNGRKKLYHWFSILVVAALLSACGRGEHGASDALSVSLQVPAGESELFWYGVEGRRLKVSRAGKILQETAWNSGQALDLALEAGDELVFEGLDSDGRVVISGQASVGEEKKVSIPLRRIL